MEPDFDLLGVGVGINGCSVTRGANAHGSGHFSRGCHIVTKRLSEHDRCFFCLGAEERIIYAIPCKDDAANSASAATRAHVSKQDKRLVARVLNVFGRKFAPYRRLAESALKKATKARANAKNPSAAGVPLSGSDVPADGAAALGTAAKTAYPFLTKPWAQRLVRAYGRDVNDVLGTAASALDLRTAFGASLTRRKVEWLIKQANAQTTDDGVWRRSKRWLRMSAEQIAHLDEWIADNLSGPRSAAAE